MIEQWRLSRLPGYARPFVALVTALMLAVCFWAVWIFYESQGKPDPDNLPAYLNSSQPDVADLSDDARRDLEEIRADSIAVLTPEWDSTVRGQERPIDTTILTQMAESAAGHTGPDDYGAVSESGEHESPFRENLGLAHTHINGQTLLYFVMGFLFLFTSATPRLKKTLYWVFGSAVLAHAIGLTGRGFHWAFDDLLAISGFTILATMAWMALLIFVELLKSPRKQ